MGLKDQTYVNLQKESKIRSGEQKTKHLPQTELSRKHYKCQSSTLVALRDLKDLKFKDKKLKLESVIKVLWILEKELKKTEKNESRMR